MNSSENLPGTEMRRIHDFHAALMFLWSLIFLSVVAVVVQWWNSSKIIESDSQFTMYLMGVIWTPFIIEAITGYLLNLSLAGNFRRLLLVVLLPPFRVGFSTFHESRLMWLPRMGWQNKGEKLSGRLDDFAMIPMLVIALMILPLIGIDILLKDKIAELRWAGLILNGCAAFIWYAFALEFLVMVSVADDKLDYCKKHWLNLIIILLPLIAFLRSFQVVRAFRVARAGKLLRVYRMRSLVLRVSQTLLAISAIERLLNRNPEKHLLKLQKLHDEKDSEIKRLRVKIAEVRKKVEELKASEKEQTVPDQERG